MSSRTLFVALWLFAQSAHAADLPTAQQVASHITAGWNLGNALEAQCGESAWGNPVVNQRLIESVKAAGFNAIRIPAAWDCHANRNTMIIDPAWMTRVKQVVDYAYGSGMYVVLNIHWDGGWLENHPLSAFQAAVNQKQKAYWTQIANDFKDYDEHLLFAGTNEVHVNYDAPSTENNAVQQSYNQTFVDAVRATGGNNASRTLIAQTYNTNIGHGLKYMVMPRDTIPDRLMVEVHYYDPYDYTLNEKGPCEYWGKPYPLQPQCRWADQDYVDGLFARLKEKWLDQGIPVILGEYGVALRPNLNVESRQYYLKYLNKVAAANGVKTFYWDNGAPPGRGHAFALFDRNTGAIVDQGALDAVMGRSPPASK